MIWRISPGDDCIMMDDRRHASLNGISESSSLPAVFCPECGRVSSFSVSVCSQMEINHFLKHTNGDCLGLASWNEILHVASNNNTNIAPGARGPITRYIPPKIETGSSQLLWPSPRILVARNDVIERNDLPLFLQLQNIDYREFFPERICPTQFFMNSRCFLCGRIPGLVIRDGIKNDSAFRAFIHNTVDERGAIWLDWYGAIASDDLAGRWKKLYRNRILFTEL